MFHQCILSHILWLHIGNCILHHSSSPRRPGPLALPTSVWGSCCFWSKFEYPTWCGCIWCFPQALNIWDNYVSHTESHGGGGCLAFTAECTGVLWHVTNMGVTTLLLVAIYYFILYFVYDPSGILAPYQSFPEMLYLLIQKPQCGADCFGPMGKCTYDTILGRKIMVTIPLQVLVSMCQFAIHLYAKGIVCLWFDQSIKKKDSPILLITFDHDLYTWIYTTNMIQKKLLMSLLLDDPIVIHKPIPKPRGWEADLTSSPSKGSICRLATIRLTGDPMATPSTCS